MSRRSIYRLSVVVVAVSATLAKACLAASLQFVTPNNSQVIGGNNVLMWVSEQYNAVDYPSTSSVVFEFSSDGVNYTELIRQNAPDFGPAEHTSGLDTTELPTGWNYLRARFAESQTGPAVQVFVDRLPTVACRVWDAGARGRLVGFDCSQSADPDGTISSYTWTFGDGSTYQSGDPVTTHLYPNFGEFFVNVQAVDDQGMASAFMVKRLYFKLEADRFSLVGPASNRIPVGSAGALSAIVRYNTTPKPLVQVVFTKAGGNFTFTSGEISSDGLSSKVITDANGGANIQFSPSGRGTALIRAQVTGSALTAYYLFYGQ